MTEFLSMGGYAFYVWGAYGIAAAALLLEIAFLARRSKRGDDKMNS